MVRPPALSAASPGRGSLMAVSYTPHGGRSRKEGGGGPADGRGSVAAGGGVRPVLDLRDVLGGDVIRGVLVRVAGHAQDHVGAPEPRPRGLGVLARGTVARLAADVLEVRRRLRVDE